MHSVHDGACTAGYLTIIPQARMGSESIAHQRPKAKWAIDSEVMRAREIIVLVKPN